MKSQENGFAHIGLVALAVVVLSVVSLAAFRVGQQDSQNKQTQEVKDTELTEGIIVVEEEKAPEVINIPVVEEQVEKVPEPIVEKPKQVAAAPVEKKKEDKVWLQMTKVVGSQDGSAVNVQSKLPQALSGTCNFKLYQEGYEKVYANSQVQNSTDCTGQLDISSLPTYEGWSLHVWFDASDGKTHAYQEESPISLLRP